MNARIADAASARETFIDILVPYDKGDVVSLAHQKCRIIHESYEENGTALSLFVSSSLINKFEPYLKQ